METVFYLIICLALLSLLPAMAHFLKKERAEELKKLFSESVIKRGRYAIDAVNRGEIKLHKITNDLTKYDPVLSLKSYQDFTKNEDNIANIKRLSGSYLSEAISVEITN